MDISAELAHPGPDVATVLAGYSLLDGSNPGNAHDDMLMPELFIIRFVLDGEWLHCTSSDHWAPAPEAAIWGSAGSMMKLRYPAPFRVFSIALRTAAWLELSGLPPKNFVDRVSPIEPIFGPSVASLHRALREAPDILAMANLADAWIAGMRRCKIRPLLIERARIFEDFALYRWERPIGEIADEFHLSTRQLERMTMQCMGFKPKFLTRRHRFLNIAAAMRGVGKSEWQELCYRYYSDQSHMSREFRKFAGMAPGEFREMEAPLLDTTLQFRHLSYKLLKSAAEQNRLVKGLPIVQRPL